MKTSNIAIKGMTGTCCEGKISNALLATTGVDSAKVSYSGRYARVKHDDSVIDTDALKQVVRDAGYDIKPVHGEDGVCCGSCGG